MRQFRNNNKRPRYRSNGDKNYKRNGQNSSFIEGQNFQRRSPGRNNQNASKLIEKYNDLAREALSNGDKILSENYFQHADHFLRISNDKDKNFVKETNGIYTSSNNQGTSENQKILEPTEVEKKII
jgi:hypothetical protein